MSKRKAKALLDTLEMLINVCADEQDQALTFHHPGRNLTLHVWVHDGDCDTQCDECGIERAELPGTSHLSMSAEPVLMVPSART